jgi:uncharacterized protein involved in exopolysaccharide biosynthesis
VTILENAELRSPEISVPWILAVLLQNRRVISTFGAIGVVVGGAIALLKPAMYEASFSFVPQSAQDDPRGSLSSLAGQLGISLGGGGSTGQSPQLYADILTTREVLGAIATDTVSPDAGRRESVADFLGISDRDEAVRRERTFQELRRKVVSSSVATRTTGAVKVTVRTRSAQVSLVIAQRLIDGLNQFNLVTRQSQAGQERRFIETRLAEAKRLLRASEDALQSFLQQNRAIGNSPQLTFEQERLQRDVSLQQQVVASLAQQYETARIREVRDTPVITILERPVLAALPQPRGRVTVLLLATGLACFVAVGYVLARAGWSRQRTIDAAAGDYRTLETEWQRFRERLPHA